MEVCRIIPRAKKNKKPSMLFRDALKVSQNDNEFARRTWGLSQTPSFMAELKGIEYDQNDEPTLQSFLEATEVNEGLDMTQLHMVREERQVGAVDRNGDPIVYKNTEQVIDNVVRFNRQHDNVAVSIENAVNGVVLNVRPNTPSLQQAKDDLDFNNQLNRRLEKILNDAGFAISREDGLSLFGVFDPKHAFQTAQGLQAVIRISKGEQGEKSIPEEFSHLTIAGLRYLEITKRIINNLNNRDTLMAVLGEDYEEYKDRYEGKTEHMAEEAAGKLLYNFIIDSENDYQNVETLLERLWQNAKQRYSSINAETVEMAIRESAQGLKDLAELALSDDFGSKINRTELFNTDALFRLNKNASDIAKDIFDEMIYKYGKIINQYRDSKSPVPESDIKAFGAMKQNEKDKSYYAGINNFMIYASGRLGAIMTNINNILKEPENDLETISLYLNQLNDFVKGVKPSVRDVVRMKFKRDSGEIEILPERKNSFETVQRTASNLLEIIENAEDFYERLRKDQVYKTVIKYWGGKDERVVSIGTDQGKVMSLAHILEIADKDVWFGNKMFASMASSTDPLNQMLHALVRDKQNERDKRIIDYTSRIRALHRMLTDSGSGTDYILERDADGNKTGRIISDIDFEKFGKARREFTKKLKEQNLTWEQEQKAYLQWMKENCTCVPIGDNVDFFSSEIDPINRDDITMSSRVEWIPRHGKNDPYYKYNPVFENMTSAQRNYYNNMIQMKRELESYFPQYYVMTYRAIMISNDTMQIIGENIGNPGKLVKVLKDRAADLWQRKVDNENFIGYEDNVYDMSMGDPNIDKPSDIINQDEQSDENKDESEDKEKKVKVKTINVKTSLSGDVAEVIPVMYVRRLENKERISNDFTASMIAYAASAINYDTMSSCFNQAKLLKDLILDRDVVMTSGSRQYIDRQRAVQRRKFEGSPVTKPGRETNIGEQAQSFFDSEFLGKRKNDEKVTIFNRDIDLGYGLEKIMRLRTMTGMYLNEFAGINNDIIGRVQMLLESQGKGFYNTKDLLKAEAMYHRDIFPYLAQLNETNYNDIMHLLIDRFNVLDDFFEELKRKGYYQSNVGKILGNTNLMIYNNIGEHHMHVVNFYAIMNNIKVKVNGEVTSFYNAFEAVPHEIKDIEGNVIATSWTAEIKTDKNTGKSIVTDLNDNVINSDGVVADVEKLIQKGDEKAKVSDDRIARSMYRTNYIDWTRAATRRVGQRLFGAYAQIDRGAGNKSVVFRMAMQFRQWMPAHYERRWGAAREDMELGMTYEGFYHTFLRFLYGVITDLSKGKVEILKRWDSMTDQEKGNCRQAFEEILAFALFSIFIWRVNRKRRGDDDDDDDDDVEFGEGEFGGAGASGEWDDEDEITFLKPFGNKDKKEMTPFERRYTRFRMQVFLQALRTRTDIGLAIPWITMPKHFLNIVDDPVAVTDQMESLIDLFNFRFLLEEVKSGPRKGENKYWNVMKKNIPVLGNWQRSMDFVFNPNAFQQYE